MKGDERRMTRVIRNRADQIIPDQTECSRFGLLGIVIAIWAKTDQKENEKGQVDQTWRDWFRSDVVNPDRSGTKMGTIGKGIMEK